MSINSGQVVQLPGRADPDDVIRRTVRALMAGAGLNPKTLGPHVRIPTSTFYERLKGTSQAFTGGEIARIADYFGVPVGDMFSGRYLPPDLDVRARRDSNPQPSDPEADARSATVAYLDHYRRSPARRLVVATAR